MSPDFGYYIRQFPLARIAHTVLGTLVICLPSGLLALGLFYLIRRPLCFLLPQPHRAALTPLVLRQPSLSFHSFLVVALSILLGAWTHTMWDSFTHDGGWAVERFTFLRAPMAHVGATVVPVSYIFQETSTFGAGALLMVMYFRWLRHHRMIATGDDTLVPDSLRYSIIALLAAVALAIAVPTALRIASLFQGYLAFRVFVFRTGVYAAAVFVPLLIFFSIALYTFHRRSA